MADGNGGMKVMMGAGVVVLLGSAVVGGIYLGRMTGHRGVNPMAPVAVPNLPVPEAGIVVPNAPAAAPDLTGQMAALDGNGVPNPVPPAVIPAPAPVVPEPPSAPLIQTADANTGLPPRYDFRDQPQPQPVIPLVPVVVPVQQQPVPVAVDVNIFAQQLQPIGEWVEVPAYQHCWRPRGVPQGWRPYTVGQWMYTQYGLMWQSDEPWGDICYHYGSWVEVAHWGWVWVPGRVWAPAWVAWRSGDGCIGWAPLPPQLCTGRRAILEGDVERIPAGAFCFVTANLMMSGHLEKQVRPAGQNTGIINKTANVTNVHLAGNNVVVNDSIDAALVEKVTGKKVQKAFVAMAGDEKDAEKLRKQGNPVIYAPKGKLDLGKGAGDSGRSGGQPVTAEPGSNPNGTGKQFDAGTGSAKTGGADLANQNAAEKLKVQQTPPVMNPGPAKGISTAEDQAKQRADLPIQQKDAAEKFRQQQAADAAAKQRALDLLKQQELENSKFQQLQAEAQRQRQETVDKASAQQNVAGHGKASQDSGDKTSGGATTQGGGRGR